MILYGILYCGIQTVVTHTHIFSICIVIRSCAAHDEASTHTDKLTITNEHFEQLPYMKKQQDFSLLFSMYDKTMGPVTNIIVHFVVGKQFIFCKPGFSNLNVF